MVGRTALHVDFTVEEYLQSERTAAEKHEFFAGETFAMAGGSREHNLVVGNVYAQLWNALSDRPCEVYPSDMRIEVEATGLFTYPDVSVVCGEPRFRDERRDTVLNPVLVVEVLSESTEAYDRGQKFKHYRTIKSLSDYVLASQHEMQVEHFTRQPDGIWALRELRDGDILALPSVGCELRIDDFYLKVFQAR